MLHLKIQYYILRYCLLDVHIFAGIFIAFTPHKKINMVILDVVMQT